MNAKNILSRLRRSPAPLALSLTLGLGLTLMTGCTSEESPSGGGEALVPAAKPAAEVKTAAKPGAEGDRVAQLEAHKAQQEKRAQARKEQEEMLNAIPAPEDVAAPPAGASTTESGLASMVLKPGTGTEHPSAESQVQVHYTGWTTDGKAFDSSRARGTPAKFPLNRVIAGWTEGLQLMVVGESRRLWIPEALAYQGRRGAPAGMLVFDVELLEIIQPPEPPKVPEDVAEPPAGAEVTASGLASRVLKKGTGTERPSPTSQVTVHYSGWTTDGKLFDSSVMRGEPTTFGLNQVIPGWTEGVGLMVEGEKRRLWIPQDLAYKGRPGPPAGMLVFDVELLKIQ